MLCGFLFDTPIFEFHFIMTHRIEGMTFFGKTCPRPRSGQLGGGHDLDSKKKLGLVFLAGHGTLLGLSKRTIHWKRKKDC